MYARITTMRSTGQVDQSDRFAELVEDAVRSATATPGCLGGVVLRDPMSATLKTMTYWSDAESLLQSRGQHAALVRRALEAIGAEIADTRVFDVTALQVAAAGIEELRERAGSAMVQRNPVTEESRPVIKAGCITSVS
jgi:quinol monooxygenase YgiN